MLRGWEANVPVPVIVHGRLGLGSVDDEHITTSHMHANGPVPGAELHLRIGIETWHLVVRKELREV